MHFRYSDINLSARASIEQGYLTPCRRNGIPLAVFLGVVLDHTTEISALHLEHKSILSFTLRFASCPWMKIRGRFEDTSREFWGRKIGPHVLVSVDPACLQGV